MISEYDELKSNITRWVTDEGARVETKSEPTTYFTLVCKFNSMQIAISALQAQNGMILLTNTLTLNDTIIQILDEKLDDIKDTMLWELRLSLVNLVDQIRITDSYHDAPWIILYDTLYIEELTREKLMKSVKRLRSTWHTAIWIVEKYAGVRRTQNAPKTLYQ